MAANDSKKKPQLTDADKALLEADPDWERMGQAAKQLLSERPSKQGATKVSARAKNNP
ncbi:hypothetical protein [Methylorubrum sp. SB2]|uniref:hypothetical protein n=1 Tax=Methylorubrum subtropicum TaxID=3138812 RepID=UPI00313CE4E1